MCHGLSPAVQDQVRVAAIDEGSIIKAMITLTAANTMIQANNGQMLVFQPTVIAQQAAEPPRLPEGSMVMYTSHIMQGEISTACDNCFLPTRWNDEGSPHGQCDASVAHRK
jgi:hypothetical protein